MSIKKYIKDIVKERFDGIIEDLGEDADREIESRYENNIFALYGVNEFEGDAIAEYLSWGIEEAEDETLYSLCFNVEDEFVVDVRDMLKKRFPIINFEEK